MPEPSDQSYLLATQYDEPFGLESRIQIQERFGSNPYRWFHWLFDRLALEEHSRILELGCGPGTLWLENEARIPECWQITLSDPSAGMLHKARRTLAGMDLPFNFEAIDTQAIPFANGHFDAVIANGVFDQVPHRRQALAEIQRVLRPGGRLYASAGGRTHLQEIEALVRPFVPDADYGGAPERFGLENGQALLSPWFTTIRRYDYEDGLVFRQPDPIVAYALSEATVKPLLVGQKLTAFKHFLQEQLEATGEIRVTTDKGLFEGKKHV